MKDFTLRKLYFSLLLGGMTMSLVAQTNIEREGESADVMSYVTISDKLGFSGGKGIDMRATYASNAKYNIVVETAGTYDLEIDYSTMQQRFIYVAVNNQLPQYVSFDDLTNSWDGTGVDGIKTKTVHLYLEAGSNMIEIGAFEDRSISTNNYMQHSPSIDKIRIKDSSESVVKPDDRMLPLSIQAENFASKTGNASKDESFTAFQTGKGGKIGDESQYGSLTYENIIVPQAGTYDLLVYYASMNIRSFYVKVNNQKAFKANQIEDSKNWGSLSGGQTLDNDGGVPYSLAKTVQVYLEAGSNKITLGGAYNVANNSDYGANIDRLMIRNSAKSITKPEDINGVYRADYTDILTNIKEQVKTNDDNIKNLFDNNENTFYTSSAPTQITVELPYPVIASSYTLVAGAGYDLANLKIERYTSSGDWMEMNASTELSNEGNPTMTDNVAVYSTWLDTANKDRASAKYRLTATGSNISIGEWQINGFPCFNETYYFPADLTRDENLNLVGSWSATSNGLEGFGEVLANLSDRMAGTKYTVDARKNAAEFNFNTATEVSTYSVGNPKGDTNRTAKNWLLRGYTSDSDNTGVDLDMQLGVVFPPDRANLVFPIDNPGEYKKYKLFVTQNAGGAMTHLLQVQFLGEYSLPTSIEEQTAQQDADVQIYTGKSEIIIKSEIVASVSIFNLQGQLVYTASGNNQYQVPLAEGLYVVRVNDSVNKVLVR